MTGGVAGRTRFSKSEMMIVAAARELAGQHVCFVGVGLPNIAVNLAQRTVAPDLELVYEAGVFGARPARLPLSIGDPTIVTGATAVDEHVRAVRFYLQGGLIDVGFLGAAQIDRFGNINTTVIGDYDHPTTRLPGCGGACEIAINARQVFVIMRQSARSFVETIDFRTSPGNLGGAEQTRADPARAGLARPRAERRRHRPRHLPLRRDRRDAPRLAPSRRDASSRSARRSAGTSGSRARPRRRRRADRRGAAAHPRGARSRAAPTRAEPGRSVTTGQVARVPSGDSRRRRLLTRCEHGFSCPPGGRPRSDRRRGHRDPVSRRHERREPAARPRADRRIGRTSSSARASRPRGSSPRCRPRST